ncbi:MAG: sigma-70 family RNA polymerase sigma factor [Gemmatimonadota bacterium]
MTIAVEEGELREWIREYTPRLLAVARAFATGDAGAEDLLQEVWWRAAQHASRRGRDAPLGAWLVAVTVNVGRDHLRRTRRRERLLARWGAPTAAPVVGEESIHEGTLLWRTVAELPTLQRETLLLRVLEGYSTAESARLLGRAEGTIKVSLARALARLRERLNQELLWTPPTTRANKT